jgi:uncharacterized membrane protein
MQVFFRWVLIATSAVVLILAIAFAAGATLPARIEVTRTVVINRPAEDIWRVLTDYNSLALWHPQYRGTRMVSNPGEKPVRWRALYTDGRSANVAVSEESFPLRYAEQISDADLPFSGKWQLRMEPSDLTTKVIAHSTAELHRPLDRLFVRLFVKPDLELDKILAGLKRRVESATVNPTPATS